MNVFSGCMGRWVIGTPLLVALLSADPALAADVTAKVIRETDLDERIAQACRDKCQGNRREGRLVRVTVERRNATTFNVWADANLRNYHHADPPKVFGERIGGGAKVYDYTIGIRAYGILNARTCNLRIERIDIANDKIGLGNLAKSEEGKVHHLQNCAKFLGGL